MYPYFYSSKILSTSTTGYSKGHYMGFFKGTAYVHSLLSNLTVTNVISWVDFTAPLWFCPKVQTKAAFSTVVEVFPVSSALASSLSLSVYVCILKHNIHWKWRPKKQHVQHHSWVMTRVANGLKISSKFADIFHGNFELEFWEFSKL